MRQEVQEQAPGKGKGHMQVLKNGPIPEIEVGPPVTAQLLAGAAPGQHGEQPGVVTREKQIANIGVVAPVVADATLKNVERTPEEIEAQGGAPLIYAVVTNDKPVTVFDKGSQNRITLKPGKQIDSHHYDLKDLARQGVRMRKVEKTEEPNAIPDWIFDSTKS